MKTAAVIFARGTGDAVPFLSARLLAGKPLLHYALAAARKAASVDSVHVSTEDERIAQVAIQEGADVLRRPEDLSGHATPLYAAIAHAARELLSRDKSLRRLVCIPADAVFCDPKDIDRAVALASKGGFERVVGVVPEFKKYVIWKQDKKGKCSLVVPPPHQRKPGEKHFSEPGVLTVWKLGPSGVNLHAPKTGQLSISEESAFRVDTEHDLRLAESLLGPKRLALRCDGSQKMGMGHVMRLANLARHLEQSGQENGSSWRARFFVGSDHLEGAKALSERGLDVDVVRSGDTADWVRRIEEYAPQVVLSDLPFVPAQYSDRLCDLAAESITLVDSVSDLDPKTPRLGTVISLLDEELPLPHARYHRGPSFAALHASVRARIGRSRKRKFPAGPVHALMAFGTVDPMRLSERCLDFLAGAPNLLSRLTIVLRKEQQDARFRERLRRLRCKTTVITSPSDRMGELLQRADIAIMSGGIGAYEAGALGAPAIVLCQNARELERMQRFERSGSIVLLGLGEDVTQAGFLRTLRRLVQDPTLRKKLSDCGARLSDGKGLERISDIINGLFNDAQSSSASAR
ncbi:MAG: NTP transferase domain-containing protein [Elusimicrobiota bacterium]